MPVRCDSLFSSSARLTVERTIAPSEPTNPPAAMPPSTEDSAVADCWSLPNPAVAWPNTALNLSCAEMTIEASAVAILHSLSMQSNRCHGSITGPLGVRLAQRERADV